jgi:hypothetical protein
LEAQTLSDRVDYFYRQRVTEAELDLGFALLEKADHDLAADIGIYGVVSGAVPTPHTPVADLSIDLSAPGCAYDHLGQRVFFGTGQTVNLAVDSTGIPTEVSAATQQRWLGVFLRFKRLLSDPRTDGNSQQVFFRRDESFEIVVRQGPQAPIGAAPKVALVDDELLICDVLRRAGQTQLQAGDISIARRQSFIFAKGNAVEVQSALWKAISSAANTVQSAFNSVDSLFATHFDGSGNRHKSQAIDYTPHGFVTALTVGTVIDEIIDKLTASTDGSAGASRIGADAIVGTPHALARSTVDNQLSQILGWLNTHEGAAANAHKASAIGATPSGFITGTSVQAQVNGIATALQSNVTPATGASIIGNDALSGAPYSLAAGSVRDQLRADAQHLNTHASSADHDARYLRELHYDVKQLVHNASLKLATLTENPQVVAASYNTVSADGTPGSTTYFLGGSSSLIKVWTAKTSSNGAAAYDLWVQNISGIELVINIGAYRIG